MRLHLLQLVGFRLLLRHLFRLRLLRLLLMHLLKVLLLRLPRRPDSMTFRRNNHCSQCHTCGIARTRYYVFTDGTDPPLLPLSEHQPAATADLDASTSRSRTHSEVSEAPTIPYQDPPHDPPRQIGQEEASLPEPPVAPPDPPSRTSSVAPTEFYSDIAKAHGP